MKRVITLLLAFMLMISLCACGSKELSAEERERIYQEVAAEKAAAEEVTSQGSPAAEADIDVNVSQIIVESLEMRLAYDTGAAAFIDDYDKFYLTAKVKNLSGIPLESLSIKLRLLDRQGNELDAGNWDELITDVLMPSGSGIVERMNYVTKVEDIAAVELLYYRCQPDMGKKVFFSEPYHYSIEEIFDVPGKAVPIELTLGDTFCSDTLQVTLHGISYQDNLKMGSLSYAANGEKILCCLDLDIKNIGNETFLPTEYLDVKVEYNNTDLYSTTNECSYLLNQENEECYVIFFYKGGGYGITSSLAPLEGYRYTLAIPCMPELAADEISPLKIIFSFDGENGPQDFVYEIR